MKKMKYFGKAIQTQRIKAKKAPKITVIPQEKAVPVPTDEPEDINDESEKENKNFENIKNGASEFIEFKVISEAGLKNMNKNSKGLKNMKDEFKESKALKPEWNMFVKKENADVWADFDGQNLFQNDVQSIKFVVHLPMLATGTYKS